MPEFSIQLEPYSPKVSSSLPPDHPIDRINDD